jgi:hypothetical protein
MKSRERIETEQTDLFRARLDRISLSKSPSLVAAYASAGILLSGGHAGIGQDMLFG